ncbi:amidohydrolase [Candidatus Chloroploca sp. M-50]|uniref:5-methylthioadenosine/S-adenosylhomocysteine deaminase n=1 Tax=Candidatus Chloroploca mongolica TaxID=2528176 RepID=A0ABS4DA72_9CHLR|nr:amidohydrolase [Candidatus Chloroploca mongolica]MBP1466323.1 amidohydrolase [Candidatus Chloroploca mongolica]
MQEKIDVLLIGGTVVTMDANWTIIADGAVAVKDKRILAVGPTPMIVDQYSADTIIDCAGCAIMPGLINAHAHVPMSLLRGMVADQQLDVWLFGYMFPVESQFVDAEFSYVGTLLSCAEMLRGGTTTFVDMYYFEEEVARAADESGMRAICGQTVMRLPTPDAASFDEGIERSRRFMEAWHTHERIVPTIAPHAPYTCTDQIYHEASALCKAFGVPLITHLSETAREVEESIRDREVTPIRYAKRVGAFDVPCIAAHCVHATEDDMRLLREAQVGAVPCPTSNLKLASGIAPIRRLIEVGVRTGLGTDGPASNDDQDMFTEIQLAALLPKGVSGDPTAVPARDALAMATCWGARAIHLDHLTGSLEPGKQADIAVVGLGRLHSAPRYTYSNDAIYSHLVYGARAADVRDVFVDGRALLLNGALQTLDEEAILRQSQVIAERINAFLASRERDLLAKIIALGGVEQAEIFEIQVKAHLDSEAAVGVLLKSPEITISKQSVRTQYDTYFLFQNEERIRIREDHRTDPGARPEPKYTITLVAEAVRGEYPHAIVLSRARYTAPADHSARFYREYFQPDRVHELEKQRRRWRILYKGYDFALNLDTLADSADPGPYLEIKARTWSSRDAAHRATLIGELLTLAGLNERNLVKQEYVEMG